MHACGFCFSDDLNTFCYQIGIPKEMTDIHGNLLWYGEYTAWGRLKKEERVYKKARPKRAL